MPGQAACARRPVTSRIRGRSASAEPSGLTGRARMTRWYGYPADGTLVWFDGIGRGRHRHAERDAQRLGAHLGAATAVSRALVYRTAERLACAAVEAGVDRLAATCRVGARRAQASAIVTRRAETAPRVGRRRNRWTTTNSPDPNCARDWTGFPRKSPCYGRCRGISTDVSRTLSCAAREGGSLETSNPVLGPGSKFEPHEKVRLLAKRVLIHCHERAN